MNAKPGKTKTTDAGKVLRPGHLRIIFSTHDDLQQAQELAKKLVTAKAAACVNILPGITSLFFWEDQLQMETEMMLIIKTTEEKAALVQALLEEHHTYDVPEVIELDGRVLHKPYFDWIKSCLN